ncbi:MAG TPA: hypothetical protein VGE97_09625 [Nitrososphaera sp.]|jgi:hypothetical protein
MLLTTSPLLLLFFNPIPVQAQTTPLSFRTTEPARGAGECTGTPNARLTLQGQGAIDSGGKHGKITGGAFQIVDSSSDGQILYNGSIQSGQFSNDSSGESLNLESTLEYVSNPKCGVTGGGLNIVTSCNTGDDTILLGREAGAFGIFSGPVECTSSQGEGATEDSKQSSSTTAGSSQEHDGDRDGIPDSSDRCTHNSNHRCFKEDTSIHQEQQPSSSSSGTANQTKG